MTTWQRNLGRMKAGWQTWRRETAPRWWAQTQHYTERLWSRVVWPTMLAIVHASMFCTYALLHAMAWAALRFAAFVEAYIPKPHIVDIGPNTEE